jgi:ribosomal protein S18 acetylase RimI-like enzyme
MIVLYCLLWSVVCGAQAMDSTRGVIVGAIVCKLDVHKKMVGRGYIAMLAVDKDYRKRRIGSNLVLKAIQAMIAGDADEVSLAVSITHVSDNWVSIKA